LKRLVLIRHAKSSWDDPSLEDRERPLNKRGKKDAREMGKRLADGGLRPDVMISSPAARAVVTAKKIAEALGYPKKNLLIEPILYGAGCEEWMEVINRLATDCYVAVLFGHNPAMTALVRHLAGCSLDNLPTCGVADFLYAVSSWKKIGSVLPKSACIDYPKNRKK
jgi:phosphohistidine phosphatase